MLFHCFSKYAPATLILLALTPFGAETQAAIIIDGDAEVNGDIYVAQQENGGLTLTAPTQLQSGGIFIAGQPELIGVMTVDGAVFEGGGNVLAIGEQGQGALNIKNGGRVTSFTGADLEVASQPGSLGLVHVYGENSLLDMPQGDARIGSKGIGELIVEDQGRVVSREVLLGDQQTSQYGSNGKATVRGDGSQWDIFEGLTVGTAGVGELRVLEGGLVRTNANLGNPGESLLGGLIGRSSALVEVDGVGSQWIDRSQQVRMGTAVMNISNGGFVDSPFVYLGPSQFEQDSSAIVTVDGPGSLWQVNSLVLGQIGEGQVLLSNGARLIRKLGGGPQTVFGANPGSSGRLSVDGPTTQWIDSFPEIRIGDRGYGELVIQNGADVQNQSIVLGSQPRSRGEVRIDGLGSSWRVENLEVGVQGSSKVEVANRATLQLMPLQQGMTVGFQGELVLDDGVVNGSVEGSNAYNLGSIRGDGEIHTPVHNEASGRIRVDAGQRLVINYQLWNDGGRVDVL